MYDLKYFILSLRCLSGKLGINEKFSLGVYFCELLTEKERIIDKIIIKGR